MTCGPRQRIIVAAAGALLLAAGINAATARAATLTIINNDGPGEGFNDPTPVAPVAGNPGTSLGQQRLNVFQAAADAWGAILDSPIEIPILAQFDPLPCAPTSGVLGAASPWAFVLDTGGSLPMNNTWYPFALANAVTANDLSDELGLPPGTQNIVAFFNSDVDDDPDCLTGLTWWYGIGAGRPAGTLDLFSTVLHEIAHGLGFTTVVNRATGQKLPGADGVGRDDVFMKLLEDHSTSELWPGMTDAERAVSAIDTGDLHWVGSNAIAQSAMLMAGVHPSGHLRMYAPDPLEGGSSVAHWDTSLFPDELMEPFAVPSAQDIVTTGLLQDIGWPTFADGCTPDTMTLCIDNPLNPGDRRFRVTVNYQTTQGGGRMGDARAIPLTAVGITKGGLFAFSDPGNPEILVKVLNGCNAGNPRWWVIYAPTTNFGFTITVEDTLRNQTVTYTNPDRNVASSRADLQALNTCP